MRKNTENSSYYTQYDENKSHTILYTYYHWYMHIDYERTVKFQMQALDSHDKTKDHL